MNRTTIAAALISTLLAACGGGGSAEEEREVVIVPKTGMVVYRTDRMTCTPISATTGVQMHAIGKPTAWCSLPTAGDYYDLQRAYTPAGTVYTEPTTPARSTLDECMANMGCDSTGKGMHVSGNALPVLTPINGCYPVYVIKQAKNGALTHPKELACATAALVMIPGKISGMTDPVIGAGCSHVRLGTGVVLPLRMLDGALRTPVAGAPSAPYLACVATAN